MLNLNNSGEINNCDWLRNRLPDKSVDLIIADPPYFEIKGDFDFVWKSFDDYLISVKETICIENWEGADFDSRYKEYIKMYCELREKLIDKDKDTIEEEFNRIKEEICLKYFGKMKVNMLNNIRNYKSLTIKEERNIEAELKTAKDNDNLFKYIKEIRKIENKYII